MERFKNIEELEKYDGYESLGSMEAVNGKIERETAKAYLMRNELGEELWVPKSQMRSQGTELFVSSWWLDVDHANRRHFS